MQEKKTQKKIKKKEIYNSLNNCKDKLWSNIETYFKKALDYTEKKEWIGAYYNIILASVNCKQYVELYKQTEIFNSKTNKEEISNYVEVQTALSRQYPELSLKRLLLIIPYYQQKVQQFQSHFGCKNETKTDNEELQCDFLNPVILDPSRASLFSDVIGNKTAIQSIEDTIINPNIMPHLYPIIAKGILFYGPPGTGKTLLARATAYELDRRSDILKVLFFAPTAEQLKGKYVGETEKKIVNMFKCASKKACDLELKFSKKSKKKVLSILFIDEIDSIARRRTLDDSSGVSANATNTFLQMMDGMNSFPNVIVIAATNLPWNLDTAILRRFNQKIYVPLPIESDIVKLIQFNIVNRLKEIISVKTDDISHERSYEDYYHRWRGLHDISTEELEVLASDLSTTSSKAGYSPRDISRLCNTVFKKHSTESNYEGGFFEIRIDRKHLSTLSNNEIEIFNSIENKYASLATYQAIQVNYPNIIDTTKKPIYPEVLSYPLTITISYEKLKDIQVYSHYTLINKQTSKIIKVINLFRKLDNDLNVYFMDDTESNIFWKNFEEDNSSINEVSSITEWLTNHNIVKKEKPDKKEKLPNKIHFMVYKVFKVNIRGTSYGIPIFLEGELSIKYLNKIINPNHSKSVSSWYTWEKKYTLDIDFIYENVHKMSFYYKTKLYFHNLNKKSTLNTSEFSKKQYEAIDLNNETYTSLTKKIFQSESSEKLSEDIVTDELTEKEEIKLISEHFINNVTSINEYTNQTIKPSPYSDKLQKVSKSAKCFNTKLSIDTFLKEKKTILASSTIESIKALDDYRIHGILPKSVK